MTRRPLLLALALLLAAPLPAAAQTQVEGWFHLLWGDPPRAGEAEVAYLLTDDGGATYRLRMDERAAAPYGGPLALDRRRVRVAAREAAAEGGSGAQVVLDVTSIAPAAPVAAADAAGAPQSGSKPVITVLCRFADSTAMPRTQEFYTAAKLGGALPSADHYWREASEGRINLAGSAVTKWYDLPSPKAAYYEVQADGAPALDRPLFGKMVDDCTGVADAEVDFRQYTGVNLQLNGYMPFSWGGSWRLSRDGETRVIAMTWMASWADHHTYAHELGHTFGLPHSSGPYGRVYDSYWDVMSLGGNNLVTDGIRQYVAVHTIAYHKDLLAWIPAAQKRVIAAGAAPTRDTVVLQRLAAPPSATEALMAQLPVGGSVFYTVEARRPHGYDRFLRSEGVIIHRVDPLAGGSHAIVMDSDEDRNRNVNDASAAWTPGETFMDSVAGVSVTVLAETGAGYRVRIARGSTPVVLATQALRGPAVVGAPYADTLRAGGGLEVIRWHVASGALPAGVELNHRTGVVAGTPTAAGSYTAEIAALSAADRSNAVHRAFGIVVYEPLAIAADSVRRAGRVGVAYADTLRASGGAGSHSWALTGGALPAGVALDPAGVLSGTPTAGGTFRFTATARSAGLAAARGFVLSVVRPVTVSSDSVRAPATMGAAYRDSLAATGGSDAFRWAVTEGRLPRGVALDSVTGRVEGVAEEAGTFRFTATATSDGERGSRALVLAVAKPSLQPAAVLDQLLGGATLPADAARFLDLLGNRNGRVDVGDVRAWLRDNPQLDLSAAPGLRDLVETPRSTETT